MDNIRPPSEDVLAGIVTYNPDLPVLSQLLSSLHAQRCGIYVFDNASDNVQDIIALCGNYGDDITLECCAENIGLSKAANQIINKAEEAKNNFVLIFDQDSVPNQNYVEILLKEYQRNDTAERPVAAIQGAQKCKFTNQQDPFVQFGRFFPKKVFPDSSVQTVHADFLITSGCLISLVALNRIGAFDEALFIDNIDVEWCARARSMGYLLIGCGATQFDHAIGDDVVKVAGKVLARIHSPVRTYYSVKNMCALLRRDYISPAWKINAVCRALVKFVAVFVFSKKRVAYTRNLFRGIKSSVEISKKPLTVCRTL